MAFKLPDVVKIISFAKKPDSEPENPQDTRRWNPRSGANVIKLFAAVIYEFSQYARVFVPGKLFQRCLMFAVQTGAYPRESPFRCSTFE